MLRELGIPKEAVPSQGDCNAVADVLVDDFRVIQGFVYAAYPSRKSELARGVVNEEIAASYDRVVRSGEREGNCSPPPRRGRGRRNSTTRKSGRKPDNQKEGRRMKQGMCAMKRARNPNKGAEKENRSRMKRRDLWKRNRRAAKMRGR